MSEQENVQLVQRLYAAFGQGDVPTILAMVAEDVDWQNVAPVGSYPWTGQRRNHQQVAQFFATLAELVEFEEFDPQEFIAKGDKVVVLGHLKALVRSTRKIADISWAMIWTIQGGKIVKYRNHEDSAAWVAALQPA
jgi:ketosteroid isomerase-like protein